MKYVYVLRDMTARPHVNNDEYSKRLISELTSSKRSKRSAEERYNNSHPIWTVIVLVHVRVRVDTLGGDPQSVQLRNATTTLTLYGL